MQKAQPVLCLSHHVLAYYWMFARDFERLRAAYRRRRRAAVGQCGAGRHDVSARPRTSWQTSSAFAAVAEEQHGCRERPRFPARPLLRLLGRHDAPVASVRGAHLLVRATSFGFIRLSDAYSTGSSHHAPEEEPRFRRAHPRQDRPRLRRPHGAARPRIKGLPLAYNKDMQEDKEGVFDAVDTLERLPRRHDRHDPHADRQRRMPCATGAHGGFMAATDLADYLVGKWRAVPRGPCRRGQARARVREAGARHLQELSRRRAAKPAGHLFDAGCASTRSTSTRSSRAASTGGRARATMPSRSSSTRRASALPPIRRACRACGPYLFPRQRRGRGSMRKPELLAPAGNRASFEAALGAGADAVYPWRRRLQRPTQRRQLRRLTTCSAVVPTTRICAPARSTSRRTRSCSPARWTRSLSIPSRRRPRRASTRPIVQDIGLMSVSAPRAARTRTTHVYADEHPRADGASSSPRKSGSPRASRSPAS